MNIPAELKYTKSHEWLKTEADGIFSVGITHHAQDLLGDMVFVEPPTVGKKLGAGMEAGVVESVKAASDVYSPLAGEIVEVNVSLQDTPEKINHAPYDAWIFKIKADNPSDAAVLLSAQDYQALIESEAP